MITQEQLATAPVGTELSALSPEQLAARLHPGPGGGAPLLLDVRQPEEWKQGHLAGAQLLPLPELPDWISRGAPGRQQELIVYCAVGQRSAQAAEQLIAAGYQQVAHLSGGIDSWLASGRELVVDCHKDNQEGAAQASSLSPEQHHRYSRQLILPEIGLAGQEKLLNSRVLLIGAGGLGSPAALYLAAAGVGTLGLVDDDLVQESNLQRQILHDHSSLGQPKATSGRKALQELNPGVVVNQYRQRLDADNARELLTGYELIIDGSDNFATRYLLNDLAVAGGQALISAAILGFAGQLTTIIPGVGPCYRCLYRQPPPAELAPSCAANGILGVVAGMFGVLQANEAIKVLLGIGQPLIGKLLLADLLTNEFNTLRFAADPECPVCRPGAPELVWDQRDYQRFCAVG